jgi:hypothetical protein
MYRFRLNAVCCVDPFDTVIRDGWQAEAIAEIENADDDEPNSYRQNGDKFGRAHQNFHLSSPLLASLK